MDSSTLSLPARNAASLSLLQLTSLMQSAEGFAAVTEALRSNRSATIDGAWKSSAALAAAALAAEAPRSVLIVLAHPGDVDPWQADLFSFGGRHPVLFPAWDAWPPRNNLVDEIASQRLRVLKQLDADEPPRLLLTTVQALLQPVPGREQLAQQRKKLKAGAQTDLDELMAWLVDHGFQRMDAVEMPGEFAQRGGILDVFSADAEMPYRIEFFGDEIDSIRQFSPESQRSLGAVPAVEITAAALPTVEPQTNGQSPRAATRGKKSSGADRSNETPPGSRGLPPVGFE
jgi:transcription-repair coupling factor (superfamily II helicase)